ncbi:MAG: hypothetical protein LBV64_01245 [Mediterranea sp.]|nr:hypothetical protein [Mediterranea sp.]
MVYTIRGVWYIPTGNYATVILPVWNLHTLVWNWHTPVWNLHNSGMRPL